MTKTFIKTNKGAEIYLYRATTANGDLSSTQYSPESQFSVGTAEVSPTVTSTTLNSPIPISNGTINDDGSNTLTGSAGGDNSTDNTTTYKPGGGIVDNTAQNLVVNDTSASKTWVLADLATAGTIIDKTQYCGLWLYIKDQTTLDYFHSSSTCLEIRLGSGVGDYYNKTYEVGDLSTGWNWLPLGIVEDLSETGTVGATINRFTIIITTNNATDEWGTGDVIYDLLRQWEETDLFKDYVTSYPTINFTTLEVTKRSYLTSVDAVGFVIDGYGDFNSDTTKLLGSKAKITARGKSDSDEFIFDLKERIIL
jgi:hypothetical protein